MSPNEKDISALEASGERFLPDMQGTIALEHLHRYAMARELAQGKVILDIACGEGYGSALLADAAEFVFGVDISTDAVAHAQARYRKPNLEFRVGSCAAIPLADVSVDLVVSFETIEHHAEHEQMLLEVKRVLRPGGVLVISSPDKEEYTVHAAHENAFHIKELYAQEFDALIRKHFANHVLLGQRVLYASTMLVQRASGETCHYYRDGQSAIQSTRGLFRPLYWIAIASDSPLPTLSSGILEQLGESDPAIKELQYQCDYAQRRIVGLQEEVAGLHEAIRLILNSRSWKLTRPFRTAGTLIKSFTKTQIDGR